jgi:hypothetical protein
VKFQTFGINLELNQYNFCAAIRKAAASAGDTENNKTED